MAKETGLRKFSSASRGTNCTLKETTMSKRHLRVTIYQSSHILTTSALQLIHELLSALLVLINAHILVT